MLVPLCQFALNDGADCVDHILAGQIVGGRNLRLPGRLLISLLLHDLCAGVPQLNPRIGMNAVVDAVVARLVAAGHPGIGRVDNGVAGQRCNIALPEIKARLCG